MLLATVTDGWLAGWLAAQCLSLAYQKIVMHGAQQEEFENNWLMLSVDILV